MGESDPSAVLAGNRENWLVTGAAGFIGSNLVEALLRAGQAVVGLDNLSTGSRRNLEQVRNAVGERLWASFRFVEGDIRNLDDCRVACDGVAYVLHHAALGSVPWSVDDPCTTNDVNVGGFLNVLVASKDRGVRRVVFASSSATYGDCEQLPQVENTIGRQLSPYAASKLINEIYADTFDTVYGVKLVGLRYFNVFGPRQDPAGAYAAVIPKWLGAMVSGQPVNINGDGETSRDFCFVSNVIDANLLAARAPDTACGEVFNIACGKSITLNELFASLKSALRKHGVDYPLDPLYQDFRPGDVRTSVADIGKAQRGLAFSPNVSFHDGIGRSIPWYLAQT